ncbi:MAG TPA: hypothetical protein VMZ22_02865 [Acidimicrobiales bacterium]|nr:hypothetical protein [Acidimicrobiales bacterium]
MNQAFVETLARADQIMVGIATKHGPHVTPELFTVSSDRVWCMTAATTLKARALAKGGRVAIAARTRDGLAIGTGTAIVIDPLHPTKTTSGIADAARSPAAVSRFVLDNAAELSGAVSDFVGGRLGQALPPHRVVLCIELKATALGGDDFAPVDWNAREPSDAASSPEVEELLDDVPVGLRDLAGSGQAFLGWLTDGGQPLVLPVDWDLAEHRATVPPELLQLTGAATSSRAAITRDDWTGYGPTGKQGLMLRGDGRVGDDAASVEIGIDGATYWDGVETGSAKTP